MAQRAHGREEGRQEESKVELMGRWQGGKQRLNVNGERKFRDVER